MMPFITTTAGIDELIQFAGKVAVSKFLEFEVNSFKSSLKPFFNKIELGERSALNA
jgi:hypothetical protein